MSGRPIIFLLSYHYAPSSEIGARRTTAVARELARGAYDVVAISHFGGTVSDPADAGSQSLVKKVYVPNPRMRALVALMRLKRYAAGVVRRRQQGDAPFEVRAPVAEVEASGGRQIKSIVTQLISLIDPYKLWSWRAAAATLAVANVSSAVAIIGSGPPMTALVAAMRVARKKKLLFVADIRDPWATAKLLAESGNFIERRANAFLQYLVLRKADLITVTTPELASAMTAADPWIKSKVHVVRNGYDGEPRERQTVTGHRLAILFAGEIYQRRNPFEFLTALEQLLSDSDVEASKISMTFVGPSDSYRGTKIRSWTCGKRCDAVVQVLPAVTREELAKLVEGSTLLLNFAQFESYSVPAKSYDQMASGREIVILAEPDGATARLFRDMRGVTVASTERELYLALRDIYARHVVGGTATVPSREDALAFSREPQSQKFYGLIAALAESRLPRNRARDLSQGSGS
jgi:hypothetical protein